MAAGLGSELVAALEPGVADGGLETAPPDGVVLFDPEPWDGRPDSELLGWESEVWETCGPLFSVEQAAVVVSRTAPSTNAPNRSFAVIPSGWGVPFMRTAYRRGRPDTGFDGVLG